MKIPRVPVVPLAALRIAERPSGTAVVLELAGRLEAPLDGPLLGRLESLAEAGRIRVVLDGAGLDYLASRGVSAFIAAVDTLRTRGGDLKLARISRQGALVLDRLGVSRLIQRFDTVEEAVQAFEVPIEDCLVEGGLESFVAAADSMVFHASGCRFVSRVREAKKFASRREAKGAGLRPCRRCLSVPQETLPPER